MKLGRLNHVGLATPSMEQNIATFRDLLGAEMIRDRLDLPPQGASPC